MRWIIAFVLALSITIQGNAEATDYYWIGGSGDWNDPAMWDPGVPQEGVPAPGIPEHSSNIYINPTDDINRTITGGSGIYTTVEIGSYGSGVVTVSAVLGPNAGFNIGPNVIFNGTAIVWYGGFSLASSSVYNGGLYSESGFLVEGTFNQESDVSLSTLGYIKGTYNWNGGDFYIYDWLEFCDGSIFNINHEGWGLDLFWVLNSSIHIQTLMGAEITENTVTNLHGRPEHKIFYNAALPENAYLGGQTYSLLEGGLLIPQVSEPTTMILLGLSLFGLAGIGRNLRGCPKG